jgi:mannosyltransferase OCH1-like enzyme
MIPKKIHYCWLSDNPLPPLLQKCMGTWKTVMPDYEWVLWDRKRFDISSNRYVLDAYNAKIYALAADYVRLYALWTEGGIFLDTDVIVQKRFDEFLEYDFFSATEWFYGVFNMPLHRTGKYRTPPKEIPLHTPRVNLQAAIMGSIPDHPFVRDCLDWYDDNQDIIKPSKIRTVGHFECIAPELYSTIAEKYGFNKTKEEQTLSHNIKIFPRSVFASSPNSATNDTYAIHCTTSSWRQKPPKVIRAFCAFYNFFRKTKLLRKLLKKRPLTESDQLDKFDEYQCFYKMRQKGISS